MSFTNDRVSVRIDLALRLPQGALGATLMMMMMMMMMIIMVMMMKMMNIKGPKGPYYVKTKDDVDS